MVQTPSKQHICSAYVTMLESSYVHYPTHTLVMTSLLHCLRGSVFLCVCVHMAERAFGFQIKYPYKPRWLPQLRYLVCSHREQTDVRNLHRSFFHTETIHLSCIWWAWGAQSFCQQGLGGCVFPHVFVHSRSRKASWYEKQDLIGGWCHAVSHWESLDYTQSVQHKSLSSAGFMKLLWTQQWLQMHCE